MTEEELKAQQEAEANNAQAAEVEHVDEPQASQEEAVENDAVKDKLAKYGETDVETFLRKVQSDAIFSRHVVRDLLGLEPEHVLAIDKVANSNQENNVTGALSHAQYPPVRVKVNPAVVEVVEGE